MRAGQGKQERGQRRPPVQVCQLAPGGSSVLCSAPLCLRPASGLDSLTTLAASWRRTPLASGENVQLTLKITHRQACSCKSVRSKQSSPHNDCCLSAPRTCSAYHYSHPPLVERLKAIDTQLKKSDGQEKKTQ